jgi:hypothetical protein
MEMEKMRVEYEDDKITYYQDHEEEYFCSFCTSDNRLLINGELLDGLAENDVVDYIEKDLQIKVKNYISRYKRKFDFGSGENRILIPKKSEKNSSSTLGPKWRDYIIPLGKKLNSFFSKIK